MMLVINPGSTSLKYSLFQDYTIVEAGDYSISDLRSFISDVVYKYDYETVLVRVVSLLYQKSQFTVVNSEYLQWLTEISSRFPLHIPPVLSLLTVLTGLPNMRERVLAVQDAYFHHTIPEIESVYALPDRYRAQYKKIGFHGISHGQVSREFSIDYDRIISCHLGGGSSICGIVKSQSVYCSMGYGVEDGVFGSARVGDISASAVLDLVERVGVEEARTMLSQQSGFLGLTGVQDVKELLNKLEYDSAAAFAIDCFIHSVVSHVGHAVMSCGGLDALVFRGGIGEGSEFIRHAVAGKVRDVLGSKFEILVLPADEMREMEQLFTLS
jgi:acetate kinase